jgi:hypothetical protein
MYPHRIRLREPWSRSVIDDVGWPWFQRGFHRPTINVGERVWIVCEGLKYDAEVSLDGRKLGIARASDEVWSRDVTDHLSQRHELSFLFREYFDKDELPWREVRLEVRLP